MNESPSTRPWGWQNWHKGSNAYISLVGVTQLAYALVAFSALTLLVWQHEGHLACKKMGMVEVGIG